MKSGVILGLINILLILIPQIMLNLRIETNNKIKINMATLYAMTINILITALTTIKEHNNMPILIIGISTMLMHLYITIITIKIKNNNIKYKKTYYYKKNKYWINEHHYDYDDENTIIEYTLEKGNKSINGLAELIPNKHYNKKYIVDTILNNRHVIEWL